MPTYSDEVADLNTIGKVASYQEGKMSTVSRIRVLHLGKVINRYDFAHNVIRQANRDSFRMSACMMARQSNIQDPEFSQEGIPSWVLGGERRRAYPKAVVDLARMLRRERIDILHVHHFEPTVVGWAASRMARSTRLVVERHYSDALYIHTTGRKREALLALERRINDTAARIIAPSSFIREILVDWQGVEAEKVEIIPYGFEPKKYETPDPSAVERLRRQFGGDGRLLVGTFARLYKDKGHAYLIEAMTALKSSHPEVLLLLAGDGPEQASIERAVHQKGLDQTVRFLGFRRDAMTVMAAVDIVVQPSLQEAFSQAMVEALWSGKPLVATDVSGAPDIISDGHNGILVAKADADALAAALERLAQDAGLRQRLGRAGRSYVEANLVIDQIIPRYEKVYSDVMGT